MPKTDPRAARALAGPSTYSQLHGMYGRKRGESCELPNRTLGKLMGSPRGCIRVKFSPSGAYLG